MNLNRLLGSVALLALSPIGFASAEIVDFTAENQMKYEIDLAAKTARLRSCSLAAKANPAVVVPDAIEYEGQSYPVTTIAPLCCFNTSLLEELTLGANVVQVDSAAFNNAYKLHTLTLNPALEKLGWGVFGDCESLTTINGTLENLSSMGDYCFQATKITEFTIPASLTEMGLNPFRSCKSLTELTVDPQNTKFTTIDGVLFNTAKTKLICYPAGKAETVYTVPDGTLELGDGCMRNVSGLSEVVMPSSLTTIGEMTLAASGITTLTIPASVYEIRTGAFYNCKKLDQITVDAGNSAYKSEGGFLTTANGEELIATTYRSGDLVIPEGIKKIGGYTFAAQTGLTSLTTPSTLVEIGRQAFASCSNLETVTLNEGLVTIGGQAFQSCRTITELTMPSTLRTIGWQAFTYQYALKTLKLNEGLEEIGKLAIYGCSDLTEITFPGTVRVWDHSICYGCSSLQKAVFEDGITEIAPSLFAYCGALTDVTFPSTLKTVGNLAFQDCNLGNITLPDGLETVEHGGFSKAGLKGKIKLPDSVVSISSHAFSWNPEMTSFMCGKNLVEIGEYGLHKNDGLTGVALNEGLLRLGQNAISANPKLTRLNIPSTVVSVDSLMINYDTSMTELHVKATTPPATTGTFFNAAWEGYPVVTLVVPSGTLEAYKAAPNWQDFQKIIEDASGVEGITGKEVEVIEIFDINGRRLSSQIPGVNILRMSDGTTRKVMNQ